MKGINHENFDFDAEFANGLTLEEAKAESIKRIRGWWGKTNFEERNPETFDFDAEFAKRLTSEEFKAEMHIRIKAYPWKRQT